MMVRLNKRTSMSVEKNQIMFYHFYRGCFCEHIYRAIKDVEKRKRNITG